jgi:hypothetical protein
MVEGSNIMSHSDSQQVDTWHHSRDLGITGVRGENSTIATCFCWERTLSKKTSSLQLVGKSVLSTPASQRLVNIGFQLMRLSNLKLNPIFDNYNVNSKYKFFL